MTFAITNHPSPASIVKLDVMTNGNKCSLLHMFTLAKLKFNDVQQMIWGELQFTMHTRSHLTNISLQTHEPWSLREGNKHVFKLSNLLDHQMLMDGDDAILGFRMMDEEKNEIVFITNSSFGEWNYV